eukprot:NODE_24700_length_614_cov_2.455852.p1 GENE.NODE_24700_length_614_cov_2.455852~~NODE_24700_length_614_cov_2.455852.p1  ORF type:complete len:84 (-),score=21.67 NODE_24700_length_614_cov_2.455852:142-393(-)
MNAVGEPIDELVEIEMAKSYSIHRPTPTLAEMNTAAQQRFTGIKVLDFLALYAWGGNSLLRGAGVGETVVIMELGYCIALMLN